MKLYAAFDLHSSNSYVAVIDEGGKKILAKKVANDPEQILTALAPHSKKITGIAVESTYNWYWLVDMLMAKGYDVHLANPSAIQKYKGLKHAEDRHDAVWLAEMLRLDILPEGYIYPKEERALRDLLRKRGHLVRLRTSLIISLQHIITRNCGLMVNVNDIKGLKEDRISPLLDDNDDILMAGAVSKGTIDYMSRQIRSIERTVEGKIELTSSYRQLMSIPGIGKILALTIMLETGPIGRFHKVGNYVSYCRKVSSTWTSNGKAKVRATKKTATSIWPGLILRPLNLRGGLMNRPGPIFRRRCTGVIAWWRTRRSRTNSHGLHTTSCGIMCLLRRISSSHKGRIQR